MTLPDDGFHSTASLPTVLFGQENSSTFPVCRTTAWMETRVRLNGAVHDPVAAVAATARARRGAAAAARGRAEQGPRRRTAGQGRGRAPGDQELAAAQLPPSRLGRRLLAVCWDARYPHLDPP